MKRKVLILLENFAIGGAQNMVYELLRCIDRERFNVDVLCYGHRIENDLTMNVEKIQSVKYLDQTGHINIKVVSRVLKAINQEKPDVVHAHLGGVPFAVLWKVAHRGSLIITAHTRPDKAFTPKIMPLLRGMINRNKVQVVAVSKENQRLLAEFFNTHERKFPFINNGINLQRFYQKKHSNFTFINVGRQDENKNQISILNAFEILYKSNNNVRLILLGDGEKHPYLVEEVKKRALDEVITIPGNVGNTEDYYAISDCYVQASHREALPLTALEAMASKLPIISTDVGGMRDIVSDKNGYLVKDDDDIAMLTAMRRIHSASLGMTKEMSNASYEKVKEYSSEQMTKKYEQLFEAEKGRYDEPNY